MTQPLIAKLFGTTIPNVSMHLKNIFAEGELDIKDDILEACPRPGSWFPLTFTRTKRTISTNRTEVKVMIKIGVSDARDNLSEMVDRARYTHERVVLTKRGKEVGAIVSIEDLKLLEALEDQLDIDMARQAIAEAGEERVSYQSLREKLGL